MTWIECIRPEEAEEILVLSDEDPRARHARDCPRCAALLDQYRLYRDMREPAEGANPEDAGARLSAFLAREIEGASAQSPARSGRAGPSSASWLERLFPPMRALAAFAALAIVLGGGALLWPRLGSRPDGIVPRGDSGPSSTMRVDDAERRADGIRLRWRSFPGADGYQVRFYSEELGEIERATTAPDTALFLSASRLAFRPDTDATVLFRVYALAHGEVLAASPARPLSRR